ncbi:hypothetical protein A1332_12970 [Methylomonas methanica]|uniref:Uncharacterized protein n=1 Tax=Methylomonas methanica TaxID=421 RepID=A0A177MI33_METMH|nr:hypothetical protein A1332_12970 [Methylomonas methanica]
MVGVLFLSKFDYRGLCFYSVALNCFVSLARRLFFYAGSRPDSRVTFLCLAKESHQKKRHQDAACSLRSEAFAGG